MKPLLFLCLCLAPGYVRAQCTASPFNGTWNSDFGKLTIWYTTGDNVVGSYSYINANGVEENGTINCTQSCMRCGAKQEDWCYVLKGSWKQTNYAGTSTGTIVFYLNYDETPWKFTGEWEADGSGQWGFWNVWR